MASSSSEVQKGKGAMRASGLPAVLRERLGADGSEALLEVLDGTCREWRADVIDACLERFERRLVEEIAGVRAQIAGARDESRLGLAAVRQEVADVRSGLKLEIAETSNRLGLQIAQLGGALRGEMSAGRVELLKWCFLFWVGQVVAIAGVMSVMLRLFTR